MRLDFPPFRLLYWIVENYDKVEHDLAMSNMPPYVADFGGKLEEADLTMGSLDGTRELKGTIGELSGADPENIFVTSGASEANFLVCAALLSTGDEVLVERPCYEPLAGVPIGLGARVGFIDRPPIDFPLDLDALSAAVTPATKLLIITNLHNPSGALIPDSTLQELSQMAEGKGFHVLCDEIFKDFAPSPPRDVFSFGERMISTVGMSKFYGTGGFRIGWMLAEKGILKKCRRIREHMAVTNCSFGENAAVVTLREREKVAGRNRSILEPNAATLTEWARGEDVEMMPWTGANVCFPKLPFESTLDFCNSLLEKGVLVSPGEFFGLPGHIRIGFAGNNEVLKEGLRRTSEAMREHRST